MLKRGIGRWDLVLLIINSIVGAGIFGLPSRIFALSGVYSILAILVCAVLMMVIILNFSEVASKFDKTGGPYLYTVQAFGRFPGYVIGWLAVVSRIFAYAALVNLLVDYLAYIHPGFDVPWIRMVCIFLTTVVLFLFNYYGIRNTTRLNNLLTIGKLIPLTLFVMLGIYYLNVDLLSLPKTPPVMSDFSSSIVILVFAFTGYEAAVVNSGEMSNPGKDIPFALISSTLFVALFYMLIQMVCIGTYGDLASSTKPIADAADAVLGTVGGTIISIGAVISIGGTLNANLLAGSRIPFAMSEAHQFPPILSSTSTKSGIPLVSLVIYTLTSLAVSLTGSFIYALSINVISKVFIFLAISAAMIKFRVTRTTSSGFKVKYGFVFGALGILICIWLLMASNPSDFLDVLATIVVGLVVFLLVSLARRKR